jgi:hypothetical protein
MRTTKPRTLEIGTIIHGTMRVQDTMPALLSALDGIALSAKDRRKCNELQRDLDAWSSDDAEEELYETLIPLAESYVPDYCYLGSHPGDGSDLGVWPCEEIFDDTRQGSYDGFCWRLRENNHHPDEESIPADMSHALAVNGRGNATLYARGQDGWTECWSLV